MFKILNNINIFLSEVISLLLRKHNGTLFCFRGKCEKKIYLFSDLGSPFGNDQLEAITEGLKSLEIQLTLM